MAAPPPLGDSEAPQPSGSAQLARQLADTIGKFVDSGYSLLAEPARADNSNFLDQLAQLIKTLYDQCQEVKRQ